MICYLSFCLQSWYYNNQTDSLLYVLQKICYNIWVLESAWPSDQTLIQNPGVVAMSCFPCVLDQAQESAEHQSDPLFI